MPARWEEETSRIVPGAEGACILVVDFDPFVRGRCPAQLAEVGYRVTAAGALAAYAVAPRGGTFDFIGKGRKSEWLLHSVARAMECPRLARENRRLLEELRARLNAAQDVLPSDHIAEAIRDLVGRGSSGGPTPGPGDPRVGGTHA